MKETHPGSTGCSQEELIKGEQARACTVWKWFNEMQRKEKKKTYHPSQDYNDDSQVDPEFRPTKREVKEADEEGDS